MVRLVNVDWKNAKEEKLVGNWEEWQNIKASMGNISYILDTLHVELIPRTWNTMKLKRYFSLVSRLYKYEMKMVV